MARRDLTQTVLIVDDELAIREALARWFKAAGWQARTVGGCAEAVGAAAVTVPDHAIVEQKLPDGSGLDLLRRLRVVSPTMSGVVLTRHPSIAAAVHAIRIGFRDYLPKPIDWVRLADIYGLRPPMTAGPPSGGQPANDTSSEACSLARIEWEHIQSVLFDCRGNISAAARLLGVHRRSLQRKLRRIAPH